MAGKKSDTEVAAVLSKISRSHLECVICHERYREPKILECLHNFCERCLVTYQESSGDPSFISCPVCRKEMKVAPGTDIVASLKTNFHIVSMVEDFTLQEQLTQPKAKKMICELCTDQQEAQSRCMDCQLFICPSCKAIHQRIPGMAGHDIVALDTLRSGAVGLRSKDEPPCERHRGEKKKFYCLACNKLICRDCTLVEHRDLTHKFTNVDEAAARGRENTRELVQNVEEHLKAFEEASTELTKMNTDLEKAMVLARQEVTNQAAEEIRKITKRQANISNDVSKRHKFHNELLCQAGIKITSETTSGTLPPVKDGNEQIYSKSVDEKLANLDSSLNAFGKIIESLLKSHDSLEDLRINLISAAAKEIDDDKSTVASNMDHFLKSIELRKTRIEEVGKMKSDDVLHMRQTLETASEVVKSGSNVDFLNLHIVINSHLRVLLAQSPHRLPIEYSKMVFKRSDDTALGELILGGRPTWKFAREINTSYCINSMATLNDEILVCSSSYYPRVFLRTTGVLQRVINQQYIGGLVAAFPDSDTLCCGVWVHDMSVQLYSNSWLALLSWTISGYVVQGGSQIYVGQPVKVAYYRNQKIVISYSSWQGIVVLDTSDGSTVGKIPVDIKPDFLACTSKGHILVASRKPACVKCVDDSDAISFTIHPTVARSTDDRKKAVCSGLCRDSRDIIYLAVSIEGANEIHIHQYTSSGSFIGCSTISGKISPPIIDIGVTGNDTLVIAEQNSGKLKLFETLKEEML